MKRLIYFILLGIYLIGVPCVLSQGNKRTLQKSTVNWAQQALQGYNMRVWLSNQMALGLQAWDCGSGDQIPVEPHYGWEYPANSGVEHLYGMGIRICGKIDGVVHVDEGYNGADARKEFVPRGLRDVFWRTSILNTGEPNKRFCDDDNDGKIDEDDLDGLDNDGDWNLSTDDVGADGLADRYEVSCDGQTYDQVNNPDPAQDNYDPAAINKCRLNPDGTHPRKNNRDIYTEKNGIPDHGEPHVDEDYGAISENDLYCSAYDTFSRPVLMGHVPMGLKCIQKSYAWDNRYLEAVLPLEYTIVNIGRDTITDIWLGFFADMDLGPVNVDQYWTHNYAAYIDSLRTAYIHNPFDRGSTPAGITLLSTSQPLDKLKIVFRWFDFRFRYECIEEECLCSILNGTFDRPPELIYPNQDPTDLSDTRFYLSCGPFPSLLPGDSIKISIALVSGYGIDIGENSLAANARKAILLHERGYRAPVSLVSPKLDALVGADRVELKWYPHTGASGGVVSPVDVWDDSNKVAESYPENSWRRRNPPCDLVCGGNNCDTEGKLAGGRVFTGFRLYRSEDPGNEPLESSFALLKDYSIPDTATEWSLERIDSTFTDSNLVRGKRYWYSVVSTGLPDMTVIKIPRPDNTVRYDTLYSDYHQSSLRSNSAKVEIQFLPSEKLGKVGVVPNPYRVSEEYSYENGGWEGAEKNWNEYRRLVKFIHMPAGEWTLRIFTLGGDVVTTIKNTKDGGYAQAGRWLDDYRDNRGEIDYLLLNEGGRALASGVYIFTVDSDLGRQTGKFVIIR